MIENIRFSSVMPWLFEKDIAKLNETRAIIAAASQKNSPVVKVIEQCTQNELPNLEIVNKKFVEEYRSLNQLV